MTHDDITQPAWRKASYCNGATACVEVKTLPDGSVLMRDSKDPDGPTFRFTSAEWAAFTAGVLAGEFDVPVLQSGGVEPGVDGRSEAQKPSLTDVGASRVSR